MAFAKAFLPALALIALSLAVFSSGCTSHETELNQLNIGGQEYVFSTNLYDSINYPVNSPGGIKNLFDSSDTACIMFNESSEQDNAYFAVVSYNMVFKISRFYANMGREFGFSVCNNDSLAAGDSPVILLKGPDTGAAANSITLNGSTITLQGMNYTNLQQAGDRLVLAVFGIESLEQDEGAPGDLIVPAVKVIVILALVCLAFWQASRVMASRKKEGSEPKELISSRDEWILAVISISTLVLIFVFFFI